VTHAQVDRIGWILLPVVRFVDLESAFEKKDGLLGHGPAIASGIVLEPAVHSFREIFYHERCQGHLLLVNFKRNASIEDLAYQKGLTVVGDGLEWYASSTTNTEKNSKNLTASAAYWMSGSGTPALRLFSKISPRRRRGTQWTAEKDLRLMEKSAYQAREPGEHGIGVMVSPDFSC
jgi:hypothetical protein